MKSTICSVGRIKLGEFQNGNKDSHYPREHSSKPNGEAIARWVYEIARKRIDAEFEFVDIKDFNLPLLDEPVPPSQGQYSKEHTKAWSAKIDSFDGYIFVTTNTTMGFLAH